MANLQQESLSSVLLSGTQNTKDSFVVISYKLHQNTHSEVVHFKTASHFTCWVCCSTQSKFHDYQGTDGSTCEQEQAALKTSQQHIPVTFNVHCMGFSTFISVFLYAILQPQIWI